MKARLRILVAATTLLVLVAFLVPLALLVRSFAENQAMSAANTSVQAVRPLLGVADPDDVRQALVGLPGVTVYLPDGQVLGARAPRTPAVELAARGGRSFTALVPEGREIVFAVRGGAGTAVIRTLVTNEELTRGVTQAWLLLAGLGLALVVIGLVVADRIARGLIRPITELSTVSHRLAGADLGARALPAGPPELREVAKALNHLARRIQELLRAEREEVADLSHRLRTPLTALRLEAESLADPADAARITDHVDALQRAVTDLIEQARRRSDDRPAAEQRCDATAIVRDRVAFWQVLADDTGRAVTAALPDGPLPVAVAWDDLAAALDALLGNVFAHTPDGTDFSVRLAAAPGGGATLEVADAGPGFPGGAAPARGDSGAGSTGLGLDIARRAAATFRAGNAPGGGAAVTLTLPPA
ncbi:HAMP domain-containing sensor histidine kinase [Spirilliplanes yamanashiensis]|uniref:histidine kinase n=1 Tax=Spirilliplanes yamanashiensis TaxID=42233 RepID=A0A8J3Y8U8_9ACTN|nr:HAMP domain-containing sensor histidine kinase [Spirilliplanes yamanashiensis]MDP9817003.1 signal transduction histidine kinase [Spirilliplanes yamanashiensis]GIJ03340.1 two-component sensor histidine kinase [Spirilliplanes yamanashiensis]